MAISDCTQLRLYECYENDAFTYQQIQDLLSIFTAHFKPYYIVVSNRGTLGHRSIRIHLFSSLLILWISPCLHFCHYRAKTSVKSFRVRTAFRLGFHHLSALF